MYKRAIELAASAEASAKGQKEMKTPSKSVDQADLIQTIKAGKETKDIVCHHYARPGHSGTVCQFKDKVCHNCKKRGQLARACKSNI